MKTVKIKFKTWDFTCGDGCCYDYGVNLFIDGVELEAQGDCAESSLIAVLTHLGYKVEIEHTTKYD